MSEVISSDDLYDFGMWSRDHKDDLGATSAWLLIERNNVPRKSGRKYKMTDEKAAVIDRAVCALTNHSPLLGNVFVAHYVGGMTYRSIAKAQKCSVSTVSNQLDTASGIVIGYALGECYKNNA